MISDDALEHLRTAFAGGRAMLFTGAGFSAAARDAAGGRGTEVYVAIKYRPPGGFLVEAPLRGLLRRVTRFQLDVELRRLRQLVETGEVAIGARNHETLVAHDARFATAAAAGAVPPPGIVPAPPITLEPARDEGGV
jgi:hypothetical protein